MSCETLLPTNIDEKLNALDLVGCKRVEELKDAISKIENFNNPLLIDAEFLWLLTDEFESSFWEGVVTDLERRKIISLAPKYFHSLGTPWAIKKALSSLELEVELLEWFEYGGKPYEFKLVSRYEGVDEKFDEKFFKKLLLLVDYTKSVRSKFRGVEFKFEFLDELNESCAAWVKPKLDQDVNLEFKIDSLVNANSASSFKAEINREKNLEFSIENNIKHYQFLNFNPTLQKEKNLELSFKKSIFNFEFSIFNLTLQKEVTIETTLNSINQIQGAVVWQV